MAEKVLRSFVNKHGERIWYYAESKIKPEDVTLKEIPWAVLEGLKILTRTYTNPAVALATGSWKDFSKKMDAGNAANRKRMKDNQWEKTVNNAEQKIASVVKSWF